MVKTYSNMLDLGSLAPNFSFQKDGFLINLNDLDIKSGLLVMFICNHCPYVIHIIEKLVEITKVFEKKGIQAIAINSNDIEKFPQDSPKNMIKISKKYDFNFPYIFDEAQEIAKKYKAACTPDIYLFDKYKKLVYRGRIDNSTPGNGVKVTGAELINALNNLLNDKQIDQNQLPSIGCNIKWK